MGHLGDEEVLEEEKADWESLAGSSLPFGGGSLPFMFT